MYSLLRSLLFLFDAEKVHYFSMNTLKSLCNIPFVKKLIAKKYTPATRLAKVCMGLSFRNLVGLGAGFDKNAMYLRELEALGFGFVEVGTVTPLPQAGNDKPRLFRLPHDKAIINRMGFNNGGMDAIAARLKAWREARPLTQANRMIIGGNIGKNKLTPNEEAHLDYVKCFDALSPYVDYFVVNVSSPNTPGLRQLQEKASLRIIFRHLQALNQKLPQPLPLLLKIAPDLETEQLDDVIGLVQELHLTGLVISNTTIARKPLSDPSILKADKIGAGGLSGQPLLERSNEVLQYVSQRLHNDAVLIGSGGIIEAFHAKQKFDAGASLVQIWTGFIYKGPALIKEIAG